jgi:hypothetical protein
MGIAALSLYKFRNLICKPSKVEWGILVVVETIGDQVVLLGIALLCSPVSSD